MPEFQKSRQREIIEAVLVIVGFSLMVFSIIISLYGLGLAQYADIEERVRSYFIFGIIFAITGIVLKISGLFIEKSKNLRKTFGFMFAIVWDPQWSPLYKSKLFYRLMRPGNIIILAINLFAGYGLLGSVTNSFWISTPQQFLTGLTKFVTFWANIEPDVFSETMLIMFVIGGFSDGLIRLFQFKNNLSDDWFRNMRFFSIITITISAIILHYYKYSLTAGAIPGVAIFWALSGVIYWLLGTWIIQYIFHFMNNAFQYLDTIFTAKEIIILTVTFLLILDIAYVIVKINLRKKRESVVTAVIK